MNRFHLCVLASDRPFYDGECESLILPTSDGLYGVQAHHRNTVAAVVAGVLRFRCPDGVEQVAAVSRGIARIENNDVLVLVDAAEHPEEIDENRALRSVEEAKERMIHRKSARDYNAAQARLSRALNRIKVKGLSEPKS